jgi:hypothetical protein
MLYVLTVIARSMPVTPRKWSERVTEMVKIGSGTEQGLGLQREE